MSRVEKMFDDIVERELFLDLVSHGTPPKLAGLEVGWTPRRVALNMADPDFAELIDEMKGLSVDRAEKKLNELVAAGNFAAVQMVLYNKRSHEWRDVRRIEVRNEHVLGPDVVKGAIEAVQQLIMAHGPAALQSGGPLDDIVDAEVVE